jgi:hypothetical protein
LQDKYTVTAAVAAQSSDQKSVQRAPVDVLVS